MSLVPSGTGVAAGNLMPDAIAPYVQNAIKGVEALPGTNAWLSRYATQIAMNPLWKHAINSALFYGGGGPGAESPVAHLGRFRPTTGEPGLEQDILAQQRLGLLLRNPIMATTPLDQFWNLQQPGQPTFDAQAAYNILRRQARGVEQARLR